MNSIWATSFKRTGHAFPMVWAPDIDWVPAVNVTDRYTRKPSSTETRVMVRVRDEQKQRVAVRVVIEGFKFAPEPEIVVTNHSTRTTC